MKKYTIKKGGHYSGFRFHPIFLHKSVTIAFMFTDESKYITKKYSWERDQWNKVAGITYDILGRNSNRIAWRYNSDDDVFEICEYKHINGVWHASNIAIVFQDIVIIRILLNDSGLVSYLQYPHYGGEVDAPHDVSIYLEFKL